MIITANMIYGKFCLRDNGPARIQNQNLLVLGLNFNPTTHFFGIMIIRKYGNENEKKCGINLTGNLVLF